MPGPEADSRQLPSADARSGKVRATACRVGRVTGVASLTAQLSRRSAAEYGSENHGEFTADGRSTAPPAVADPSVGLNR